METNGRLQQPSSIMESSPCSIELFLYMWDLSAWDYSCLKFTEISSCQLRSHGQSGEKMNARWFVISDKREPVQYGISFEYSLNVVWSCSFYHKVTFPVLLSHQATRALSCSVRGNAGSGGFLEHIFKEAARELPGNLSRRISWISWYFMGGLWWFDMPWWYLGWRCGPSSCCLPWSFCSWFGLHIGYLMLFDGFNADVWQVKTSHIGDWLIDVTDRTTLGGHRGMNIQLFQLVWKVGQNVMDRCKKKSSYRFVQKNVALLPRFSIDVPSSPLTLQTKQNEDMREAGGGWFFSGWPSRISVTWADGTLGKRVTRCHKWVCPKTGKTRRHQLMAMIYWGKCWSTVCRSH